MARERFDQDPEQARASLRTIEETSKQASKELGGLVGLLRSDHTPPTDGLDAVHRAVTSARSTGPAVDLRIDTLTSPPPATWS